MQNTTETDNNQNNGNNITLDLRVSCNTFWKYEMKLTVNRDDFVEPNANNANDINCGGGGAGSGGSCCSDAKKNTCIFKTRKISVR